MPRFRVRFTIRRIMTVVVVLGIVLAVLVRVQRHRTAALWQIRLERQQAVTRRAEAVYFNARQTRELTELFATASDESNFKQELVTAQGALRLRLEGALIGRGALNLTRAEDRLDGSKPRPFVDLFGTQKRSVQEAGLTPDQDRTRRAVREKYMGNKTLAELKGEVASARADEAARKAIYDREKSVLKTLLQEAAQ
jgi:hypothetical protein